MILLHLISPLKINAKRFWSPSFQVSFSGKLKIQQERPLSIRRVGGGQQGSETGLSSHSSVHQCNLLPHRLEIQSDLKV